MVVRSNISALNAQRNLGLGNSGLSKNLEKLSSGYKVNRAADDAAGLAISEKMRSQIRGMGMAEQNTADAINLIQTAEGALNETHAILQRMRELAVQSSNGTYTDDDRAQIAGEYGALMDEVDRISDSTHYNGMKLFGQAGFIRLAKSEAEVLADPAWNNMFAKFSGQMTHSHPATNFSVNPEITVDVRVNSQGDLDSITLLQQVGNNYTVSISGDTIRFEEGPVFVEISLKKDDFANAYAGGIIRFSNLHLYYYTNSLGVLQMGCNVSLQRMDTYQWGIGQSTEAFHFQIGANGGADQTAQLELESVNTSALGIGNSGVSTLSRANDALLALDDAISGVSSFRARLGAMQNRLQHTMNSLGVSIENLTAAESTIRDTDMANDMMEFTKQSILVQAAQAMLAQANTLPQGILSLLG